MTLHTKYRPKTWDEVIGQDAAVTALRSALEKKSSRCFFLAGPPGTGKTTLARIAAKSMGAKKLDITEVDAATHTGIDDMRLIASNFQYHPLTGTAKANIIDECHALSPAAVKALLKPTEEPPEHGYWFFCTTDPGKIPAALKSRGPMLNLKPVKEKLLVDLLNMICDKEELKPFEGLVELCADQANGSPRQAIVNLETCLSAPNKKVAAQLLRAAGEDPKAIELARALMGGKRWADISGMLKELKTQDAESIRRVVRGYVTATALAVPKEGVAGKALEISDAFSQPFFNEGFPALVLACGHVTLGGKG